MEVSAGYYTYIRHTDPRGNRYVVEYRTWNHDILLGSLLLAAEKENDRARKDGNTTPRATVESISEAQYQAERVRRAA